MYRACEAYQNGAISDTSYTLMLARFDKTMASMLASEIAAGAFGRNLATLGGSASTGGVDPKKLSDAREEVKAASDQLQKAAGLKDSDPNKQPAITAAREKLNKAVTDLVEIEFLSAVSAAQSGPPAGSGGVPGEIKGRPQTINSDVVGQIHANFLDDDASGTIIDACVIALDRNRAGGASDPAFATEIKNATQDVTNKIRDAATKEKNANEASQKFDMLIQQSARMNGGAGGVPTAEQQQQDRDVQDKKKAAENATFDLTVAKNKLEYLKNLAATPTLGNICAAMLKNGTPEQNFLLKLQENKLKARVAESDVILKQQLAKGCAESTKDIPVKTGRAEKYAACISRALSLGK